MIFKKNSRNYTNLYPTKREITFFDIIKWELTRKKGLWPNWIQTYLKLQIIETSSKPRITWINHATMLIQMNGVNLLTDPIWSKRASPLWFMGPKRITNAGIKIEELPNIDYVLIHHDHYDHLDYPTIKQLEEKFKPIFITGEKTSKVFSKLVSKDRRIELNWWQEIKGKNELKITFLPAHHWSQRGLFRRNKTLWGSFMLSTKEHNVFFAGDTAYSQHFQDIKQRFHNIDIAILPIGAYKPEWIMKDHHMGPKEAVKITQELNLTRVIPMHYGCFMELADESIDDALEDLKYYIKIFSVDPKHFTILSHGEHYQL